MHIKIPEPLNWTEKVDLGGLIPSLAGQMFSSPTEKLARVPKLMSGYQHNIDVQRWVLFALRLSISGASRVPNILLWGPKGSGKSTAAEQIFAALKIPCDRKTCGPRDLSADLMAVQSFNADQGHHLVPGPLFNAFTRGYPFILNEAFRMDPGELSALNDVIERGVYTLPNGDEIEAAPGFLLVLTDNTNGKGDLSGMYAGVQTQNESFLDRLTAIRMDYMCAEQEIKAAVGPFLGDPAAEAMASVVAERMVTLANLVRNSTVMAGQLGTRTVCDVVSYALSFSNLQPLGINPIFYALKAQCLEKLDDVEKTSLVQMLKGMGIEEHISAPASS